MRVGNRGTAPAENVTVAVFAMKLGGAGVPAWPHAGWTALTAAAGSDMSDVAPGAATRFGPFKWRPKAGTYALFVTATCASDPANTDPATGWRSAEAPVPPLPLDLRVACDNNLGFRTVTVS